MHHNKEEQQHFTATTLINQVFTAPQQIKAPQPINNIQPPQPVPTRRSPTYWKLYQQQQVQSIQLVQHQSGATAYKGTLSGAVGGTVGSILTDVAIDGYENVKVGKAVAIGALCLIPYVGIGFQTLMASVAIGGITSSDFLSSKEKWQQIGVLSTKIAYSVGACYSSIELGMAAGAVGGPVGVVVGGIIGGLFGGIISNIGGRMIDDISQKKPFELVVSFGRANKSNIVDGYMHDSGINPKCIFQNLGGAAKSIILIAQTERHIAWVLPNIKPSETVLKENCNRGLILCAETQSRYLGPDTTQQQITFMAFGIKEEYVDENQCLRMLHDKELTIICQTEKKINV